MFAVLALVLSLASCSADEKQPADTNLAGCFILLFECTLPDQETTRS